MFNQIKSSSENKVLITELTRRFGLGAENVIARIAIAYSLHSGLRFSPLDVKDSGGKEYTKNVLFGNLLIRICTPCVQLMEFQVIIVIYPVISRFT